MAGRDEPVCVVRDRARLGESPLWVPEDAALYWVDIRRPALHRYRPATGDHHHWAMPELVGSIGRAGGGRLVAALASGLHFFDTRTGALDKIVDPEPDFPAHRLNDGKVDPAGRYWVGSCLDPAYTPVGSLWRIDTDRRAHRMLSGVSIPNSLAWSPDHRTLYFSDSRTRQIWAFAYDPATGAIADRRVFATVPEGEGSPDGATVDAKGYLWSAQIFGGRVTRYAPDGRIDRVIRLPVTPVTSCAFGGPRLETLYVTTATTLLDAEALARQPLAGSLFAVEVGVRGLVEPVFAG